jgi:16S rRNA (guanine527-N7)-methyltransferase
MRIGSPEWKAVIGKGAAKLGVTLPAGALPRFAIHAAELVHWNHRVNLTAIIDPFEIAEKHFTDSLAALPWLKTDTRMVDIGSGAGFPGIPIKVAAPSIEVVLLESSRKKAAFMKHVIRRLNLGGIEVWHGRAEDYCRLAKAFVPFDTAISRALGGLDRLVELAAPMLSPDGTLLAMRGRHQCDKGAGATLCRSPTTDGHGRRLPWERRCVRYYLPFSKAERSMVLLQPGVPIGY